MATDVQVAVEAIDGRAVVVKSATAPEAIERLRAEAARLRRARHPGVVELLDERAGPPHALVLAWAGGPTLETADLDEQATTAVLASVAATVADLHRLDLVHGRIEAGHVVLDGGGRPRLCGLGDGTGREPDVELRPSDDVAGLGRLIERLVGPGSDPEPIPDRRWARRRWGGFSRRALQLLADQATDPDPDRRPSARTLAAALRDLAPGARLQALDQDDPAPMEADPVPAAARPEATAEPATFLGMRVAEGLDDDPEPPDRPRRRSWPPLDDPPVPRRRDRVLDLIGGARPTVGAIALAVVALLVGAAALTGRGPWPAHRGAVGDEVVATEPGPEPRAVPPTTTAPHRSVTTTAATTAPVSSTVAARCGSTPAGPSADVDGDGCPEPVAVDGTTVRAGPATFEVGTEGDIVGLGDWTCSGRTLPLVVRPASGEVFVFEAWPRADRPVTQRAVTLLPAGSTPDLRRSVACGHLAVRTASGGATDVPLAERGGR